MRKLMNYFVSKKTRASKIVRVFEKRTFVGRQRFPTGFKNARSQPYLERLQAPAQE